MKPRNLKPRIKQNFDPAQNWIKNRILILLEDVDPITGHFGWSTIINIRQRLLEVFPDVDKQSPDWANADMSQKLDMVIKTINKMVRENLLISNRKHHTTFYQLPNPKKPILKRADKLTPSLLMPTKRRKNDEKSTE